MPRAYASRTICTPDGIRRSGGRAPGLKADPSNVCNESKDDIDQLDLIMSLPD